MAGFMHYQMQRKRLEIQIPSATFNFQSTTFPGWLSDMQIIFATTGHVANGETIGGQNGDTSITFGASCLDNCNWGGQYNSYEDVNLHILSL